MMITDAEIDAGADALRKIEQSGKNLRDWVVLPRATKNKWREKSLEVLLAAAKERTRVWGVDIPPSRPIPLSDEDQ